jgi:alkanesulfonate monooxygenase SsuD/methylene tetrahydromethanopterin reductase-like flavin-dependent oxidoreductase (luciferase family)
VFLTPAAADPHRVVDLAVLAEEVGLDLVTFQDHPYQPRFLDTWTLLAYVAARTERVTLGPNVLNLPLRPPAVAARAAASLDLLSRGRVALGLGAGAFWDAIAAMGGARLTPGESVQALGEAIDVIRALWDTSATGPVRAGGPIHAVVAAKRGPAPTHPVPIWVGGYRPRILRLVGSAADGWLPSLGPLAREDLGAAQAAVDAAARSAGRDPRAVRRLLNVPAGLPPDELRRLADEGVETFVVMTDEPAVVEDLGSRVRPALRA